MRWRFILLDALPQYEFEIGAHVLAMYPHTTKFHSARVNSPPSLNSNHHEHYVVEFDADAENENGIKPQHCVPVKFVIPFPTRP